MMAAALVVFKGGTAFNSLLEEFKKYFPYTTYVVPITDDGGSSREIARVFGGPSIGDLRSTLTRLSDESTAEVHGVKKLLEHRLPSHDSKNAQMEWQAFLDGSHLLYASISPKYKELIIYFLDEFEKARVRCISNHFDLRHGSIGNFFFSGARMSLRSLESAISMYSTIAHIPPTTHIFPIIDSEDSLRIGVELKNREIIIGQHMISHPNDHGYVDKSDYIPLPASITKLFYLDQYQNRVNPKPYPKIIHAIQMSQAIIYGMGSLWTSIIPSLVLQGIGEAIASAKCCKVGVLNCCHDRETTGMSAIDYIQAIVASLNRYGELSYPPQAYFTHLFVVEGGSIPIEEKHIQELGIEICKISSDIYRNLEVHREAHPVYAADELIQAVIQTIQSNTIITP